MRVIGGEFRSRRLNTLPGLDTRPTPDRLRETLFNVLAMQIDGVVFMDAYAGTGAVGIEALSRGAARCIFIEKNRAAVEVIRDNLATLGLERRAEVHLGKVVSILDRAKADIVFLDPPYQMKAEYEAALLACSAKLVIAQHASRDALNDEYTQLKRYRILKQGDNSLSFYANSSSMDFQDSSS